MISFSLSATAHGKQDKSGTHAFVILSLNADKASCFRIDGSTPAQMLAKENENIPGEPDELGEGKTFR
jgi:hypothetical protein